MKDPIERRILLKHLLKYNSGPDVAMSKLRLNMSMSLDGFVAGPEQSEENRLGVGGMELHKWLTELDAFEETHCEGGGKVNASTPIAEGFFENVGAGIMGRNMFGGSGPRGTNPWRGFWGEDPPYHHPVLVLKHHAREPLEMQGGTTFHFVTEKIESALEQAKEAAAGKDVSLAGGASVVQQFLAAGLLDEMLISVAPIFLGDGARLFDDLGDARPRLEQVQVVEAPGVTHIRYRAA